MATARNLEIARRSTAIIRLFCDAFPGHIDNESSARTNVRGADVGREQRVRLSLKNSSKLPILGIASEEDCEGAAAVKKIVDLSGNTYSRLEMLKNAGHAASMLAKEPDVTADIVIWFRSNLPIVGYGLPPTIK